MCPAGPLFCQQDTMPYSKQSTNTTKDVQSKAKGKNKLGQLADMAVALAMNPLSKQRWKHGTVACMSGMHCQSGHSVTH